MKRLLLLLLVATIALNSTTTAQAQVDRNLTLKASAGLISLPDYINLLLVGLGSIDPKDNISREDFTPCTAINLEMLHPINHWMQIGASLSSGYASAQTIYNDTGALSRYISSFHNSLCFLANTTYWQKNNFAFYGSWGLGATLFVVTQKDADTNNTQATVAPMGNIYPICMKFGNLKGAYLELGWGAKGIVTIGGFINF